MRFLDCAELRQKTKLPVSRSQLRLIETGLMMRLLTPHILSPPLVAQSLRFHSWGLRSVGPKFSVRSPTISSDVFFHCIRALLREASQEGLFIALIDLQRLD